MKARISGKPFLCRFKRETPIVADLGSFNTSAKFIKYAIFASEKPWTGHWNYITHCNSFLKAVFKILRFKRAGFEIIDVHIRSFKE